MKQEQSQNSVLSDLAVVGVVIWVGFVTIGAVYGFISKVDTMELNALTQQVKYRIDYMHTYQGFNQMKCDSRGGYLVTAWENGGDGKLYMKQRCIEKDGSTGTWGVSEKTGYKEIEL